MIRLTVALLFVSSSTVWAQTSSWRLEEGSVRFTCEGPQIRDAARGHFSAVSSQIVLDPDNLATARGAMGVVMTSLSTELHGWDTMFRSAPFLNVGAHPRATFEVLQVEGATALRADEETGVQLVGRLTVNGVAREMTIPARIRWHSAGDRPERVEVLTTFLLRWTDHDLVVPEGWTRHFAGDGARLRVHLVYRRT